MKKLSPANFVERSIKIHKNKYDYSKSCFINVDTKVLIICKKHGEFWQRPDHHLSGRGCKKCATGRLITPEKIEISKKSFLKQAKIRWNNKFDYSKSLYVNAKTKILVSCPIHGDFLVTPDSHLNHDCMACSIADNAKRQLKKEEIFINQASEMHNNFYSYDKSCYIGDKRKILITCPLHGDFWQLPYNHLMGKGCQLCKTKSRGEIEIKNILTSINLKFERQKTFIDCINPKTKRKLLFDFYVPNINLCIEFNGEHHYRPISCWGGEIGFNKIQINDKIKNKYCKQNKISLFRLNFNDRKKRNLKIKLIEIINYLQNK